MTDWANFTTLSALIATEYKPTKDAKPIFGVIGVSADTASDAEAGTVVLSNIKATEINFSALDLQPDFRSVARSRQVDAVG
ncbi:hypothetical protein LP421_30850 (plasmid) [Rhizobium sp. RCAM05350]|nr:hypothetical protein LP421_30850 [Rhizobium sp. RCAM05350]